MLDTLKTWANRFKWLIFILASSLGGLIGLFMRVGTSQSLEFYLIYVRYCAIGWAVIVGIVRLLTYWIEIED